MLYQSKDQEKFKPIEEVMLNRNKFADVEDVIKAMKEKEKATEAKLRPKFSDVNDERHYRKKMLVYALRIFGKYKWHEGVAGHITVRDPENTDTFWVNPMGRFFGALKIPDLLLVDSEGNILQGVGTLNRAAYAIHSAIHRARPDVVAACHAHTPWAKAWSTTGRLLDPLTQDSCSFFEDHAIDALYTGVVFGTEDGDEIAKLLGQNKAIILRNHGHIAVGETVESAVWSFISFERSCEVQIKAESCCHLNTTGKPHCIDYRTAKLTQYQVGSQYQCWFQFQTELEALLEENPELRNI